MALTEIRGGLWEISSTPEQSFAISLAVFTYPRGFRKEGKSSSYTQ